MHLIGVAYRKWIKDHFAIISFFYKNSALWLNFMLTMVLIYFSLAISITLK